jgi:hypothetical protein
VKYRKRKKYCSNKKRAKNFHLQLQRVLGSHLWPLTIYINETDTKVIVQKCGTVATDVQPAPFGDDTLPINIGKYNII